MESNRGLSEIESDSSSSRTRQPSTDSSVWHRRSNVSRKTSKHQQAKWISRCLLRSSWREGDLTSDGRFQPQRSRSSSPFNGRSPDWRLQLALARTQHHWAQSFFCRAPPYMPDLILTPHQLTSLDGSDARRNLVVATWRLRNGFTTFLRRSIRRHGGVDPDSPPADFHLLDGSGCQRIARRIWWWRRDFRNGLRPSIVHSRYVDGYVGTLRVQHTSTAETEPS
jgi:hypothetical protein